MSAAGLRAYASSRVAVCTAAFALVSVASAAHPFRGLSLSSLWLLDAVARFDVWRAGGDVAAMRAAFADPEGVLPFVPWVASLLPFPSLLALRVLGVVAAGVTAASVASIGHRFWGAGAGFFAACALLALPRFVAAATTTTPTIFALAAVSSLVAVALASRDDARWLPLLAAVGGAAWSTSLYAWLAAIGVAYLVVVDAGRRPTAGHVRIRAVPLATLLMPALWAGALIAAAPYLHAHTFERLGRLLGVWLERRGEPLLFAGRFYGAARIPALSPPVMWAISAPVTVVIVAVGGAVAAVGGVGSRRPADARQVWGTIVALAWALPVALRSAYHGGVDLWALGALPLALSAGVGLEGLAQRSAAGCRAGRPWRASRSSRSPPSRRARSDRSRAGTRRSSLPQSAVCPGRSTRGTRAAHMHRSPRRSARCCAGRCATSQCYRAPGSCAPCSTATDSSG